MTETAIDVQALVARFKSRNVMVWCEKRKLEMRQGECERYQAAWVHTVKIETFSNTRQIHPRFTGCLGCPNYQRSEEVPTNRGLMARGQRKHTSGTSQSRIGKNAVSVRYTRGQSLTTPTDEETQDG